MTKEEIFKLYESGKVGEITDIVMELAKQTAELRAEVLDLKSKHEFTETAFNSLKMDNLNLRAEVERLTKYNWKARCETIECLFHISQGTAPKVSTSEWNELIDIWQSLVNTPEPDECKHNHVVGIISHGEYLKCTECNKIFEP